MYCTRITRLACIVTLLSVAGAAAAEQSGNLLNAPEFQEATDHLTVGERFQGAALMHLALHEYHHAIAPLEVLLRREDYQNRADLWHLLAVAYNRVNEPAEALSAARIAQALQPDLPGLRLESGIAAVRLNHPEVAINDLEQVNEKWQTSPSAHYYLGLAYAQDGQYEKAREQFDRAIQLNPLLMTPIQYQRAMIDANQGRLRTAGRRLAPIYRAMRRKQTPGVNSVGRQLAGLAVGIQAGDLRRSIHAADVAAASRNLPTLQPRQPAAAADTDAREATIAGVN